MKGILRTSKRAIIILSSILLFIMVPNVPNYYHIEASDVQSGLLPIIATQEIGSSRTFWEFNFTSNTFYELDANLMALGDYCYIYMQDSVVALLGESEATSRCNLYSDEFDTTIYPLVTELTGDPDGRIGDIDDDPRIIILLSENTASYYAQTNEIVTTYSNQCEMVYIYYNTFEIIGTIAHEFCHLIWFNYEFDEVHFVLEGLAEYATKYAGYFTQYNNLSSRTSYFLNHYEDSLVYFDIAAKDYGGAYLFTFYLAERFGLQFLRDLVQQEVDGALGIEITLQDAGYDISFNELFLDWITALVLDDTELEEGQYGFEEIDFQLTNIPMVTNLPSWNETQTLYYYGMQVREIIDPSDSFAVEVGTSSRVIGLSIAFHDEDGWHIQKSENATSSIQGISGVSIDTAYVITTYLNLNPPSGNIDFGVGSSIEVNLASGILPSPPSDISTNNGEWIVVGISLVAIAAAITVLIQRKYFANESLGYCISLEHSESGN